MFSRATLGGEPGHEIRQPSVLEEMCAQAGRTHQAGGCLDAEPSGGKAVDGRIGLGESDVTGHERVIEERRDANGVQPLGEAASNLRMSMSSGGRAAM